MYTNLDKKNKELNFVMMEQPENSSHEQWWIPGLLPKRRLTLLSAMGGTGKTSLAAHLAKRLATEQQARVFYWSFEDTPQDFTNKIGKIDLLYFMHEKDEKPINLGDEKDSIALNNWLYEQGADILIIDPISALLSGDTNDNQKVRAMLNPLLRMTDDLQLTILGIHHFRKAGKGGGDARCNIMGASAWVDSSRHVLSLVKNDQDQRFLEVVKSNISKTGQSWEVFTGLNDYGHFCVTGMADAEDGAVQRALESPEEERVAPVIRSLKAEFDLGQPFNLDDIRRCGNFKSFYNWKKAHPGAWQECEKKKDGKKSYIFI